MLDMSTSQSIHVKMPTEVRTEAIGRTQQRWRATLHGYILVSKLLRLYADIQLKINLADLRKVSQFFRIFIPFSLTHVRLIIPQQRSPKTILKSLAQIHAISTCMCSRADPSNFSDSACLEFVNLPLYMISISLLFVVNGK